MVSHKHLDESLPLLFGCKVGFAAFWGTDRGIRRRPCSSNGEQGSINKVGTVETIWLSIDTLWSLKHKTGFITKRSLLTLNIYVSASPALLKQTMERVRVLLYSLSRRWRRSPASPARRRPPASAPLRPPRASAPAAAWRSTTGTCWRWEPRNKTAHASQAQMGLDVGRGSNFPIF